MLTTDEHKLALALRDDFDVRFECNALWERFADERSDPELMRVVKAAIIAELTKRVSMPNSPPQAASVQLGDSIPVPRD